MTAKRKGKVMMVNGAVRKVIIISRAAMNRVTLL